jgi:HAD superfamily hydrolase (TIGR01509 family)
MTTAAELIANAKALLLDFDGPVTALMPPPLNTKAADQARAALAGIELPEAIATTTDHLTVLRFTAEHFPGRLASVEGSCTEAEVACARESDPSPEIRDLLSGAERREVPVAIVSNNSEAAVRVFLDRAIWARAVKVLACRTPAKVPRMKPDPYLVREAMALLNVRPADCVFVGDSVSDVIAGQRAGVQVVGLAKTPQRGVELMQAGCSALITRPD